MRITFLLLLLLGVSLKGATPNVALLQERATKGDAGALNDLGCCYGEGNGVEKDLKKAESLFIKAIDAGCRVALFNISNTVGDIRNRDDLSAQEKVDLIATTQAYLKRGSDEGEPHCMGAYGSQVLMTNPELGNGVLDQLAMLVVFGKHEAISPAVEAYYALGLFGVPFPTDKLFVVAAKGADLRIATAYALMYKCYSEGLGVKKDIFVATDWLKKAALHQGHAIEQMKYALALWAGVGVPKNVIDAYAWARISADIYPEARKTVYLIGHDLSAQEQLVAEQRAAMFKARITETEQAEPQEHSAFIYVYHDANPEQSGGAASLACSGSGAFVTTNGYILTAAHVVKGAHTISVMLDGAERPAKLVQLDDSNDLAVLKVDVVNQQALPIRASRGVRLGEPVATIGYPNIDIQGYNPKVTRGEISSLSGLADDPRAWQISVPVQPGNSGGPLLDEYGNLIGVVVAKLGTAAAKLTGDIPQNVSYAVKASYAIPLLDPYLDNASIEIPPTGAGLSLEDLVVKVQKSVVLIIAR